MLPMVVCMGSYRKEDEPTEIAMFTTVKGVLPSKKQNGEQETKTE
jgi:hypothetical protein